MKQTDPSVLSSMASSLFRLVAIAASVVILLVGEVTSAPDMFTALVDMQRALTDEQSAAFLMKQYVDSERHRLLQLERYIHSRHCCYH